MRCTFSVVCPAPRVVCYGLLGTRVIRFFTPVALRCAFRPDRYCFSAISLARRRSCGPRPLSQAFYVAVFAPRPPARHITSVRGAAHTVSCGIRPEGRLCSHRTILPKTIPQAFLSGARADPPQVPVSPSNLHTFTPPCTLPDLCIYPSLVLPKGARIDQARLVRPGGAGHQRVPGDRHRRREADRGRVREGWTARGGEAADREGEAVPGDRGADGG